jgi:hypothetical protein
MKSTHKVGGGYSTRCSTPWNGNSNAPTKSSDGLQRRRLTSERNYCPQAAGGTRAEDDAVDLPEC